MSDYTENSLKIIDNLLLKEQLTPLLILKDKVYKEIINDIRKNKTYAENLRFLENRKYYLKKKLKNQTEEKQINNSEKTTGEIIEEIKIENKDKEVNLTINRFDNRDTQSKILKNQFDAIENIKNKIDRLLSKTKVQDYTLDENGNYIIDEKGEQRKATLMSDQIGIVISNTAQEMLTKFIGNQLISNININEVNKYKEIILNLYEVFEKQVKVENKEIYRLKNIQSINTELNQYATELKKQIYLDKQRERMELENLKLQKEVEESKVKEVEEELTEEEINKQLEELDKVQENLK